MGFGFGLRVLRDCNRVIETLLKRPRGSISRVIQKASIPLNTYSPS